MMTFEQFRATGKNVPDVAEPCGFTWDDDEGLHPGRIYCNGQFYIERLTHDVPITHLGKQTGTYHAGDWFLMLGREDWITPDLGALEARLFIYALEEGAL